jgi:nucleoside-diphosphate-sugar epimerase
MTIHVIVGAGSVGSATARMLAAEGHEVRVVSRTGRGPDATGIQSMRMNATDRSALTRVTAGAAALYNCANPPYHRWATDWPPLATAMLGAASDTGAVLVTVSNLYGYGPTDHPIQESDPLAAAGAKGVVRAQMWRDALSAHQAGNAKVTEVRSSDYFGPGVVDTSAIGRLTPRILSGKSVRVLGNPDAPHSWTYVPDVARALVVLGKDARGWGWAWHVPTAPPITQRQFISAVAREAGVGDPSVGRIPRSFLSLAGVFSPTLRELRETSYQFDRPFVLDSSKFSATFGMEATPFPEAIRSTVQWSREHSGPSR